MAKNALLIPEKPDKSDKDLQCFSYKREGSSEENITVKMMKDKIYIETTQYVNADSYEDAIGKQVFSNAINKALLIHILSYSESVSITKVEFFISDKKVNEFDKNNIPFDSLVPECVHAFPQGTRKEQCIEVLKKARFLKEEPKEDNNCFLYSDNRLAALNAWIIAKSKRKEMERFIYLWIAINGMAQYLSKEKIYPIMKQYEGLYNKGKDENNKFEILKKIDFSESRDKDQLSIFHGYIDTNSYYVKVENDKELSNNYINIREMSESEKAKLTIDIPYYYRCSIFHANDRILIYSISNKEKNLIEKIKIMNDAMELYIDDNLFKWFDNEHWEMEGERLKRVALSRLRHELEIKGFRDKNRRKANKVIDWIEKILGDGGDGSGQAQPAAAQSNATNN